MPGRKRAGRHTHGAEHTPGAGIGAELGNELDNALERVLSHAESHGEAYPGAMADHATLRAALSDELLPAERLALDGLERVARERDEAAVAATDSATDSTAAPSVDPNDRAAT